MPSRMASVPNRAMNADSPAIITLSGMARLAMAAISVPSRKQVRFTSLVASARPARASRLKSSKVTALPIICEYSSAMESLVRHCAQPRCPDTQRGPSGSIRICPARPYVLSG